MWLHCEPRPLHDHYPVNYFPFLTFIRPARLQTRLHAPDTWTTPTILHLTNLRTPHTWTYPQLSNFSNHLARQQCDVDSAIQGHCAMNIKVNFKWSLLSFELSWLLSTNHHQDYIRITSGLHQDYIRIAFIAFLNSIKCTLSTLILQVHFSVVWDSPHPA